MAKKAGAVGAVGAVAPELAVAGNAVTKAGQAIKKPVIGRKRTLDYTLEIEREGQIVEAQVHEERGFEVGALGAGLLTVGALAVGGTAVAVATHPQETRDAIAKRKQAREDKKAGGGSIPFGGFGDFVAGIGDWFLARQGVARKIRKG